MNTPITQVTQASQTEHKPLASLTTELKLLGQGASLHWNDLPTYKSVLLLQGPVGAFFTKLGSYWKARGSSVYKINFNPGDDWFYPPTEPNTLQYRHRLEYWEAFVQSYLASKDIKAVFLFGECRPIHQVFRSLCKIYQIDLWVLEEGYYRPGYYTLERDGVNAHSSFAQQDMDTIMASSSATLGPIAAPPVYASFRHMVKSAIIYWMTNIVYSFSYPNYDHHRELNWAQGFRWTLSLIRYWQYRITERAIKKRLKSKTYLGAQTQEYFLFPLQVHDDSQMTHHSDYASVENVIEEVVNSFYQHLFQLQEQGKPWQQVLVIKHHPMNRGHRNYKDFISTLSKALGIENHVVYVHDIKLPLLLPRVKGCVTVNSTLGLQALFHGVPVINLGRSFYDKPRITFQGSLDQFWANPGEVDAQALVQFKRHVIANSQIAGCLYDPSSRIS
jgi:capsular polysaccharide export protein